MDDSMKLYWETVFDEISTEKSIRHFSNPLREYEDEFIPGAIIDIGCGQSDFLLDYANASRKLYAIDNEEIQLDYLKKRAKEISTNNLENWDFTQLNFPEDELPKDKFSVIILSNILHFFSIEECVEIEKIIDNIAESGTMIYISVHSYKFYANKPENPDNNDYFKHYFKTDDLETIFPKEKYEYMYVAEIEKIDSKFETEIASKWLDKDLKNDGITNIRIINKIKKDYLKDKMQSDIQTIIRKL